MSKLVRVEDVVNLINGLESLPWETETEELVNSLPIYDTEKVANDLKEYGKYKGVLYLGANGAENYIPARKAVEIVKKGGI